MRFAVGRSIGVIGRQMLSVAIGYELYERTGSKLTLGLVGLVQVIPVFALFVPGGILADKFDRRFLSAISSFGAGVACLLLAAGSWAQVPLWVIYALLLLLGSTTSLQSPASSALLPMLVAKRQLQRANAIRTTAFEAASVAGPAIAGLALALVQPFAVYAVSGVLLMVSAGAYATLPKPRAQTTHGAPAGRDLWVGLRFIFNSPLLLPALTLDLFAVLFAGATALLPVFAKDVLHVGPQGLGLLRAAPAVGALAMSFWLASHPLHAAGRALFIGVALFGLATLALGLSRSLPLSLAILLLLGAADMVSVVIRQTLVQLHTPDEMRGRVSSVNAIFIGASNQLGEFESGLTAQWFGLVPSILLGGSGTLLVVGLWMRWFPQLLQVRSLEEAMPAQNRP